MKLIKKIAAIMFAFMMVFSLSTNAKAQTAESGEYGQKDGKIVINNAIEGNDYKIYRLLKLESYSGEHYSYKLESGWEGFIQTNGAKYLNEDENGYITIKSGANLRWFAKEALAFAKTANLATDATDTKNATSDTVTFDNLPLGYYVVGSTVGSLCELNTTDKEATIQDKNEQPSVVKEIRDVNNQLVSSNSVNVGDAVTFQLTINVKPGAENYVVHDKMDDNLTFIQLSSAKTNTNEQVIIQPTGQEIVVTQTGLTDGCAVEFSFTQAFYNKHRDKIDNGQLTSITLIYGALVSEDAHVNVAMNNKAYLTFGEKNTKSEEKITTTKTFGIPVFKCTKDDTPLEGAEFILTTVKKDKSTALKFTLKNGKYRYDESGTETFKSLANGHSDIEGIKAGTYYLQETKAPKGYNLLKEPKTVEIAEDGTIKVDNGSVTEVKVVNNSGTILPSTGGIGTTLIYLIGGALVLGSGFVLANKKRAKAK